MVLTADMMENNRVSWSDVMAFLEASPRPTWKNGLLPIVESAIAAGLSSYFRAGQSMHHVILSTAERHGLEEVIPAPPRITLGVDEYATVYVAWSHCNLWFGEPERKDVVTPATALPILKSYLGSLWTVTRSAKPIPFALAEP